MFCLACQIAVGAWAENSPGNDVTRAIELYKKGDMQGCSDLLRQATSGSARNNALAHYYLANALVAIHRAAEARAHYEAVYKLAPSGSLHELAKRGILSVGGTLPQPTSTSTAKTETTEKSSGPKRGYIGFQLVNRNEIDKIVPNSPAAIAGLKEGDLIVSIGGRTTANKDTEEVSQMTVGTAETNLVCEIERQGKRFQVSIRRAAKVDYSSIAGVRGKEAKTGDPLDSSMVSILRQTGDSKQAHQQVLQALSCIPHSVKEELTQSGVKILITPSITDARPEKKGQRPEGYVHGGDYENCPGMYTTDRNTLYIAERAQIDNNPRSFNTRIPEVALHELGHAYDFNKNLVTSSEFKEAYRQDMQHLSSSLKERYYYYTQEADQGHELFAELFATANGSHDTPGLDRAFPRCYQYIKGMIAR